MLNEYPEEAELQTIEQWPTDNLVELFEYIKTRWRYADYEDANFWVEKDEEDEGKPVKIYEIATGGWSGNEDIIEAMQKNIVFWYTAWYKTERGGKFTFKLY